MARKPEALKLTPWHVYKVASKAVLLGTVEATDASEAIEKGATEFKVTAKKLMAVRRR